MTHSTLEPRRSSIPGIQPLLSAVSAFGLGAGLLYLTARVLDRVKAPCQLYFYELMSQPVRTTAVLPSNLLNSIELRELRRGDPALADIPVSPEKLDERFAMPTVCLGAFQNGRMIAYMWLCFGDYEEDEVRCRFVPSPPDKAVWDFDFYVFPEDRLGIGFVCLWDYANALLTARGYTHSCSRVNKFNLQSRKSHKHFAWASVGRALFLKGRRWQAMAATLPPYVSISLRLTTRPVIRVMT